MLKIKVKKNNDILNFKYKSKKSNTMEHLLIIAKMYNFIKDNTDMLDEEIENEIKKIIEQIKESE